MKTIRDPVHGDITFSQEEMALIDTPEFQRLRGIRQLGTSHLVFPGAQHSRFEHSLGTCWLLKKMVGVLNQRARRANVEATIDTDLERTLAFAALLHDITHIPFGHTFEDERRILPPHDKSRVRLHYYLDSNGLGRALRHLGARDDVYSLLSDGSHPRRSFPPYARELISGAICADLLDYLARDAYFCGLKMAYDSRIFDYLDIESQGLCFELYTDRGFRQDAWSELINLLRIRYFLTERVYYHHTKTVSGAMLSRILEEMLAEGVVDVTDLYELQDDSLIYVMQSRKDRVPKVAPLIDAFVSRRLYKRVYMVCRDPLNPGKPEPEIMQRIQDRYHLNRGGARTNLELQLCRHLGVGPSDVVVYAPDTDMRLKEANVQVRVDAGPIVCLSDLEHPELEALIDGHRSIWRFFLFMNPDCSDKFVKASRFMERQIGVTNQLELQNKGQLTFRF